MLRISGDVNIYYYHDTLTPANVRCASYGTAPSSGTMLPEVGDILHDFPGWTGEEYESLTVRVTKVDSIGNGCQAFEVHTTTVTEPDVTLTKAEYLRLLRASYELEALEEAGVDNWIGHDEVNWGAVDDAMAGAEAVLGASR